MPDRIQATKILCEGGLNRNENSFLLSSVSPGSAYSLINYETNQSGGYRRINGFAEYNSTYPEVTASAGDTAEGKVLGIWVFYSSASSDYEVIAARKLASGNTYKFYKLGVSGWTAFATGFTHVYNTTIYRVRAEQFNFGDGNKIIFVDGVNKAVIYDGTNWKRLASTSAGGSGDPGGNQVLDSPVVVTVFKNHVFMAKGSIICYSAPADPYTWTVAAGGGQMIFHNEVINIKPWRDQLFIFGSGAISQIKPYIDNNGDATFLIESVTDNLGCIARDSIIELAGNLLFLAPDGIRPVAGTDRVNDIELGLLSEAIQTIINDIIDDYDMQNIVAVDILSKTQFRYFITDDGDTTGVSDAYGLIGCYRQNGTNGPLWEFMEMVGIRASCVWSGIVNNQELILHGDYNGKVYRQETGNTFDGTNIVAIYTTPYLDLGDTEIRKKMRKLNLFIKPEGSITMSLAVRYDWGDSNILNPRDYIGISVSSSAKYDSGVKYDDGSVYGGASVNKFSQNIEGSGFSVQFSIVTDGTSPPYTIQGFVPEFSVKGRD